MFAKNGLENKALTIEASSWDLVSLSALGDRLVSAVIVLVSIPALDRGCPFA